MAVLAEAISVIVRRDAVDSRFPGGWSAFQRGVPNNTLCFDGDLARVGFMTPFDVWAFVSTLEAASLAFHPCGEAVDFSVVDQRHGPTVPARWLTFGKLHDGEMTISACWLAGKPAGEVALPVGWNYEHSLSAEPGFVANEDISSSLKFLRREVGKDVYLDLGTGEEMFVGRPIITGETREAITTRLEALFYEAVDIEAKMQISEESREGGGLTPHFDRLRHELLPEADSLAAGPGREMWLAHFDRGLILRLLTEVEDAESAYRKANELRPGVINTLRELVLCLGEQGRHEEALPFAREAVRVAPDDAGAWGNLAITLLRCGEGVEARSAIDRAVQLDPNDAINRRILDNFDTL